mmetsp:Transcript_16184/g.37503  ORF Transcript_16184/g.37503 Transcript_16184/m.37503 type:complete len:101 (+) Transcript_16184:27-329(+)
MNIFHTSNTTKNYCKIKCQEKIKKKYQYSYRSRRTSIVNGSIDNCESIIPTHRSIEVRHDQSIDRLFAKCTSRRLILHPIDNCKSIPDRSIDRSLSIAHR